MNSSKKKKKYLWQKDHLENQTGTINSVINQIKLKKNDNKKYETWKK